MLYKNTFSTEHLQTAASEFLQKDIDEYQTKESTKKIHLWSKKGKNKTQMPVTITEDLTETDMG